MPDPAEFLQRHRRLLLGAAAVLTLLVATYFVFLPMAVHRGVFNERVETWLSTAAGADVTLGSLRFDPWGELGASEIAVSGPTSVRVRDVRLRFLSLQSVLHGPDEILVSGVEVRPTSTGSRSTGSSTLWPPPGPTWLGHAAFSDVRIRLSDVEDDVVRVEGDVWNWPPSGLTVRAKWRGTSWEVKGLGTADRGALLQVRSDAIPVDLLRDVADVLGAPPPPTGCRCNADLVVAGSSIGGRAEVVIDPTDAGAENPPDLQARGWINLSGKKPETVIDELSVRWNERAQVRARARVWDDKIYLEDVYGRVLRRNQAGELDTVAASGNLEFARAEASWVVRGDLLVAARRAAEDFRGGNATAKVAGVILPDAQRAAFALEGDIFQAWWGAAVACPEASWESEGVVRWDGERPRTALRLAVRGETLSVGQVDIPSFSADGVLEMERGFAVREASIRWDGGEALGSIEQGPEDAEVAWVLRRLTARLTGLPPSLLRLPEGWIVRRGDIEASAAGSEGLAGGSFTLKDIEIELPDMNFLAVSEVGGRVRAAGLGEPAATSVEVLDGRLRGLQAMYGVYAYEQPADHAAAWTAQWTPSGNDQEFRCELPDYPALGELVAFFRTSGDRWDLQVRASRIDLNQAFRIGVADPLADSLEWLQTARAGGEGSVRFLAQGSPQGMCAMGEIDIRDAEYEAGEVSVRDVDLSGLRIVAATSEDVEIPAAWAETRHAAFSVGSIDRRTFRMQDVGGEILCRPGAIELGTEGMEFDILGGRVAMPTLVCRWKPGFAGVRTTGDLTFEDISVLDVARFLGWEHEPTGTLDGWGRWGLAEGDLTFAGGGTARVFGGVVRFDRIDGERILSDFRSIRCNAEVKDVDLQAFTATFPEIGSVGGVLEGFVHDFHYAANEPWEFEILLRTVDRPGKKQFFNTSALRSIDRFAAGQASLPEEIVLGKTWAYRHFGFYCAMRRDDRARVTVQLRGGWRKKSSLLPFLPSYEQITDKELRSGDVIGKGPEYFLVGSAFGVQIKNMTPGTRLSRDDLMERVRKAMEKDAK